MTYQKKIQKAQNGLYICDGIEDGADEDEIIEAVEDRGIWLPGAGDNWFDN